MSKKIIENGKIHFYQTSTEEVIDLGDNLSLEEIGYYLIIKNIYIKYCGVLNIENLPRYAKIFHPREQKKLKTFAKRQFQTQDFIKNDEWDAIINEIQEKSEKAAKSVVHRWNKDTNVDTNAYTNAYTNEDTNVKVKDNVNVKVKDNTPVIPKQNYAPEMINIWNEVCTNLKKVNTNIKNADRAKNLNKLIGNKELLDEKGLPMFENIADWGAYCEDVNSLKFLTGENDRGWVADIDFCIHFGNKSGVKQVLEGKYDNNKQEGK